MAVEPQVGVGGCGPVGQHHIEPVQRERGQQVIEAVLVAEQAQVRFGEHRREQLARWREVIRAGNIRAD